MLPTSCASAPQQANRRWLVFGRALGRPVRGRGDRQGIGHPSVPSGDVAVVEDAPDGDITQAEFDAALRAGGRRQGLPKVPAPSDPQYATLRDSAMSRPAAGALGPRRGRGARDHRLRHRDRRTSWSRSRSSSAARRAVPAVPEAGSASRRSRRATRSSCSCSSDQIQKQVLPQDADVSESEIEDYYEANKSQFSSRRPATCARSSTRTRRRSSRPRRCWSRTTPPESWKKVAAQYSTDKATKDSGGLRQGVAEGQSDPALDEQIFSAAQGELVGPFKGQSGYYLIQVEKITPAQTTPLDKVSEQIKQQLGQGEQQQIAPGLPAGLRRQVDRADLLRRRLRDRPVRRTSRPPVQRSQGAPPVISTRAVSPGQRHGVPRTAVPALPQGPDPAARPPRSPACIGPGGAPLPAGRAPPAQRRAGAGASPRRRVAQRRAARRSAPRRDHPPPAPRVPLGPRAGRALDRPAHGRGGLRARRRGGSGDDAKLVDELGDVLFQVHFLALLLEERGAGSLAEVAEGMVAEADPPPSARLRGGGGRDRGRGAAELGPDQARGGGEGRRRAVRRRAREPAGAALCAKDPAARRLGRARGRRARRADRRPGDSARPPSAGSARPCSRSSTSRAACASTRSSRCAPRPSASATGSSATSLANFRGHADDRAHPRPPDPRLAGQPHGRGRGGARLRRAGAPRCRPAPRPASSRPPSCATAARPGAARASRRAVVQRQRGHRRRAGRRPRHRAGRDRPHPDRPRRDAQQVAARRQRDPRRLARRRPRRRGRGAASPSTASSAAPTPRRCRCR